MAVRGDFVDQFCHSGELRFFKFSAVCLLLLFSVSLSFGSVERQKEKRQRKLTVAVLWFENKTADAQQAHWHYAIEGILKNLCRDIGSIRLRGGVDYGRRELGMAKGASVDSVAARKIGEIIEVQRVIWGSYTHEGGRWHVVVHVLNVASGEFCEPLEVDSNDFFEMWDILIEQVLKELKITPSEKEREKLMDRFTTSVEAMDLFARALSLQEEHKSLGEQEALYRKSIAADPNFANAYSNLGAALASQGKLAEAEQMLSRALELKPDYGLAHLIFGGVLRLQGKTIKAERAIRQAHRLWPDESYPLFVLANLYAQRNQWDEVIAFADQARILEPMNAGYHALLGAAYARKGRREQAIAALKEAQRLLEPESMSGTNTELSICQAYEFLGEIPLALEHYERFVEEAKKIGLNPEKVGAFEKKIERLKLSLTPSFVEASMPRIYTVKSLDGALKEKLTEEEMKLVFNPLDSSPEIKGWAEQLTAGATSDFDKAKAIFDEMIRRPGGTRGRRTAREVFAAWEKAGESFNCQEYAKLFVAMARDVKIKAFYAYVWKNNTGNNITHACAAVFAEGKTILADPSYRWFGVPHKGFRVLDDVQIIALDLSQTRDLKRNRIAVKLYPDFALIHQNLALGLISEGQWEEARKVLERAEQLDPNHWCTYSLRGIFALNDGDMKTAVDYLKKSVEIYPEDGVNHFYLGSALLAHGKLEEAREEFRASLRAPIGLEPDEAESARRKIAAINEQEGVEGACGPEYAQAHLSAGVTFCEHGLLDQGITEFTKVIVCDSNLLEAYSYRGRAYYAKGRYDLCIQDFTKALEIKPKDPNMLAKRAAAYIDKGQYDLAMLDCNMSLEVDKENFLAYLNRASVYINKEQYDSAILDLNEVLAKHSDSTDALYSRALAYFRKELYDQAIVDLSEVIKVNPNVEVYSLRAESYLKKEQYDAALSDCEKAIELNPDFALAYRTRGFVRKAKKDFDGAISDFNKFQELSRGGIIQHNLQLK